VTDEDRLHSGIAYLESKGHRVVVAPETYRKWRYFAGADEERLAAFHRLLSDPAIDVMIITRGGYGWSRMLHRIDWQAVSASGKSLVGFSDFTAFNLGALAMSNLVTFAGPAAGIEFASAGNDAAAADDLRFMEQHFWPMLRGEALAAGPFTSPHTYASQRIEGPLWGSNLSMLAHLIGTPYFPGIEGGILFLEEIDEQPYAVERLLYQLFHAGVLQRQKAILLGDFSHCTPDAGRYPYSMDEVVETLRSLVSCPVLTGLPFGHVARKLTLPYGATCGLDIGSDSYTLEFPAR
jgi:muramoyltetrapeptide carboxypeptidase